MNSPSTVVSALDLLRGMHLDALDMAARGFASPHDIDTAMRLGAGHPEGPFQVLAGLDSPQLHGLAYTPDELPEASPAGDATWSGRVAVVGTGLMATGIIECASRAGLSTTVLGRSDSSCQTSLGRLGTSLDRAVERGRMDRDQADAALGQTTYTTDAARLSSCDLVIEAVAEDIDTKHSLLRELDAALPAHVWFATNTSSYTVAELAQAVSAKRVVSALHFFNPAPAMKLIEIVEPNRGEAVIAESMAFARTLGKKPVVCGDERGFIVNRLLIPYLNDAVRAVEEGVEPSQVDAAVREQVGHPMGPIALLDLIGLDVTIAALESMHATVGEPRLAPAATLRELVSEGRLGKKVGHGFYQYSA